MDPRVIDAGEVPNNAVDTNIPRMHGGNHPPPRNPYHHVVSEDVLRSYPLVGELHPSTSTTTAVSSSMVFQKQQQVQHQHFLQPDFQAALYPPVQTQVSASETATS